MMPCLGRYDEIEAVISPFDPIDDVCSWICGLNSLGYTSDILATIHGQVGREHIKASALAIAVFARSALGLLQQAYSGPPESGFLPLYYAMLNLSKVYIVASGGLGALATNRYHGLQYKPQSKDSHDIRTEQILVKPRGVFPLFYAILSGHSWTRGEVFLRLGHLLPYLRSVSFEFSHAYDSPPPFQVTLVTLQGDPQGQFRLVAKLDDAPHPAAGNLRFLKVMTGFRPVANDPRQFQSTPIQAESEEQARPRLARLVRRTLFYQTIYHPAMGIQGVITPLSNKHLLMIEEIPIWATFFYLSSIVRYKPEFLDKLKDTHAWPVLLTMRKHCTLRFLILFWSFLHQKEFIITPD
jgi:hypothetical protein